MHRNESLTADCEKMKGKSNDSFLIPSDLWIGSFYSWNAAISSSDRLQCHLVRYFRSNIAPSSHSNECKAGTQAVNLQKLEMQSEFVIYLVVNGSWSDILAFTSMLWGSTIRSESQMNNKLSDLGISFVM